MLTIQDILQKADELILEVQENSITPPRVGELIYALAELIQQGAAGGTTIGIRKLSELEDVELAGLKNLNILQLLGEKWRNVEFDIVKLNNLASIFMVDEQGRLVINDGFVSNALSHFNPGFWVGDFTPGMLGTGARLIMDNGISKLEVDQLVVRMTATFFEVVISRLKHIGGQLVLSPASMKCLDVEEYTTYYRCYMDTGGGKSVNEFVLNDQARCQVFTGTGLKFYWRLVVGVGADYIDLSKSDAASGSGAPVAGDDIVQLGNRTNTARQSAQVLSTVGDDAPSYKQYAGINSYTLTGCEQTVLSPAGNKIIGDVSFRRSDGSYENMDSAVTALQGSITDAANDAAEALANYQETVSGLLTAIEDGILSDAERTGYANWLNVIARDKSEIQASYQLLYDNSRVDATRKANLLAAKNALYGSDWTGGAYAALVTAINAVVTNGDNLITAAERTTLNNAFVAYNASISTYSQRVLEAQNGITGTLSEEITDAANDAATALANYQNTVNGLLNALEDDLLSDAERTGYANWLNVIARDKSEIQASYQLLYDNSRVNATLKANLLAAKNALYGSGWTGGAYASLVTAINAVVTNGDELITAAERTTLNNAFVAYNAAISTYSQRVLEAQNGITGALGGEITDAANDAATALSNYQNTVNGLLTALEDGILSDAERAGYANWLNVIARDKSEIQASYQLLYDNTRVNATLKANLLAAKNALYGASWTAGAYAALVTAINAVVTNGDNLITAAERTTLNDAFVAYNAAISTYSQRVLEAQNGITGALGGEITDAANDAATALSNYQNTVNGLLTALEDGILSDAERTGYANWLNVIARDKSEIQASYQLLYDNSRVDATRKANLLAAKNALYGADWTGGAYAALVTAINAVVTNGDELITAAERTTLNNAFVAYNAAISTYSQRVLEAQNGITGALGGEITDAANDAATALSNYQNTVNGLLNALEDGVLSDAERTGYANWLNVIARDKSEIQASYQLLYDNTRVNATQKTNLLAAKNALYGADWTGGAYATLVTAINAVVTNGDNLITAAERTTLTNAFGAYNTALGTYAQRVREAENGIYGSLGTEIADAQGTADDAYNEASVALGQIVDMGADGKLTPVEKLQTRQIWNSIAQEYTKNITQAGVYGVSTTAYTTKYNVLNSYLNLTGGLLVDMTTTSTIIRTTYETRFNEYYAARQELLNNVVLAAKAYSNALINNLYVGGVNLIIGSTRTVTADAQGNGQYMVIYGAESSSPSATIPYLENGQKYVFSVGQIVRLAGTTTNVRVLLYDLVNNTSGPYTDTLTLSTSRQFFTFTVPATGYYSLLIYSGIWPNFESNSIRYSQLMLQKGEVYTQFTESLRHLTEAFEGSTEIQGGVIATNLLMMKDADGNVTAGMSGLDDNIWLWSGGNYGAAGTEDVVDLFRKDGSGFLAGKKIGWDVNGGMNIGEFKIEGSAIVGYDEDSIRRLKVHNGTLTTLAQFQSNAAENSGFSYEIPNEKFLFINKFSEDLEFEYIFKPAKGKLTIPAGTYVQFNPPMLVLPDIEPTLFTARRYSRYFSIYKNGIWQQDIATFSSPVQVTSGGELDIVFNLRFYATMKAGKNKEFTLGSEPVEAGYVAINVDRARTEVAKTGIASYWATNTYLYMEKDHGFEVRFGNYILQILPTIGMRKSTNGGSTWSYL